MPAKATIAGVTKLLLLSVFVASPVWAWDEFDWDQETREEILEDRQDRLGDRIERGEESGRLSDREVDRLEDRDERIDEAIDQASDDGFGISDREARQIDAMQDRQARAIRNELRDGPRSRPDYGAVEMQGRGSYPYKGREFGPGYGAVGRGDRGRGSD